MRDSEKVQDWVRWVKGSRPSYKPHAIAAVYAADGPKILASVLKALGMERTEQLIEAMCEHAPAASPSSAHVNSPREDTLEDGR